MSKIRWVKPNNEIELINIPQEWLNEHDKQIRNEVIDEFVDKCKEMDNCYVSIYQVVKIAEQLKGEQND